MTAADCGCGFGCNRDHERDSGDRVAARGAAPWYSLKGFR